MRNVPSIVSSDVETRQHCGRHTDNDDGQEDDNVDCGGGWHCVDVLYLEGVRLARVVGW